MPLLEEIVETTRELVGDKLVSDKLVSVTLDSDAPRRIVSDPVQFRQIVLNLASNAAKVTKEQGWAWRSPMSF